MSIRVAQTGSRTARIPVAIGGRRLAYDRPSAGCKLSPTDFEAPAHKPMALFIVTAASMGRMCPGPVGPAYSMITPDMSAVNTWESIQDTPVTGTCAWSANSAGLYQSSNTWGNYPHYNTLIGCNAVLTGHTFTNFILEVDIDATGIVSRARLFEREL